MADSTRKTQPGKRAWARRCAAQALYEWQVTNADPRHIADQFLADDEAEDDLAKADPRYFRELLREIPARAPEIDAALVPFLDRPLAQVDPVERAILRIGGYELLHHPEIAYRIVLNEAVELAKVFGAEQGHRYVNGVLDKMARSVRTSEFTAPS